jgi:exonuclease III
MRPAHVAPNRLLQAHDIESNPGPASLTFIQWNCESIAAKATELQLRAKQLNADVLLIQETHLRPCSRLKLAGYTTVRMDRSTARGPSGKVAGGGVLIGIREELSFELVKSPLLAPNDITTDAIAVKIFPNDNVKRSLTVVNVYVPPIRPSAMDTRQQLFDPQRLPHDGESLIFGDFNGHSALWQDGYDKEPDGIGTLLEEFLTDNNFLVANDGQHTCYSHSHGSTSTPDVCLIPAKWASRVSFDVAPEMGGSDHRPIVVRVQVEGNPKPSRPKEARFAYKKAKWDVFAEVLDKELRVPPASRPAVADV